MKTSILLSPAARRLVGHAVLAGALCWSGPSLLAQNAPPAPAGQAQPGTRALLTQDDLRELVGPIALYPDALIALILPASTVPSDVVLGARFVETKQDPNQSVGQPWDDSIKSLVYYPDVLSWMSENLEWTASLGEAFMDQPADVMNAIQGLRAQAKASGALTDTPQQKVVVQEEVIRIVPADPEVIYVPQYDPEVIFVESYVPSYTPFLTFGIGFAVGSWLNYDCDWGRRSVYRGDWVGWNRGGWNRGGWNRGGNVVVNNTDINVVNTNVNVVNINGNTARRWEASPRSVRQIAQRQRDGRGNVRFTTPQARQAREMIRQERRQNNGKVAPKVLAEARRNALPAPGRLEVREAAFNRVAKAGGNRESSPAPARKPQSETPNRPGGAAARKAPTEAPRVTGQMEAARQARRETANRPAPSQPTLRERATARRENAPSQVPTRAPQVREQNRASVAERQREAVQERRDNRASSREQRPAPAPKREVRPAPQRPAPAQRQEARQERREVRPQRQEARQEQRSARPQRQEARPEPRASRPQAQQPKREARPQRQEARPQRQEARQERREERKEERKKKD